MHFMRLYPLMLLSHNVVSQSTYLFDEFDIQININNSHIIHMGKVMGKNSRGIFFQDKCSHEFIAIEQTCLLI